MLLNMNDEVDVVHDWLLDKVGAPAFADAYKGASCIIDNNANGMVHFVSCTGRDIINILASLVGEADQTRVDYVRLVGAFADEWLTNDYLPNGLDDREGPSIPIDRGVLYKVEKLVQEHKTGEARNIDKTELFFSTFFDYNDLDIVPASLVKEWKEAKKWFSSKAHLRATYKAQDTEQVRLHFKTLSHLLYQAAISQHSRLEAMDDILATANA